MSIKCLSQRLRNALNQLKGYALELQPTDSNFTF